MMLRSWNTNFHHFLFASRYFRRKISEGSFKLQLSREDRELLHRWRSLTKNPLAAVVDFCGIFSLVVAATKRDWCATGIQVKKTTRGIKDIS